MPLRGLGANGRGTSIAIAEAFDYAGKMGLRVVNASLGGPGLDQSQLAAIQAHPNTLYVIAAGNDNVNVDATPYGPCALPAANVMCVGASDENDRKRLVLQLRRQQRRRVRARHGDPVDLPLARVRVPAGHVDGQPERGRRRGARALGPARPPARSTSRARSWRSTDAKPELAGKAVTGGRVNADRAVAGAVGGAPANVSPPVITGTPRQGVALGASVGHLEPGRSLVRLRLAALVRRRLDLDADRRRDRARCTRPGASDIGAKLRVTVTATNPYGVASATSAAVGPVASGAPVSTGPPVISGTPRRGQVLTSARRWNPAGTSYAYQWQRSTDGSDLDRDRRRRVDLHAHDRRARGARARDRHGDQRLRPGVGDQRPGRPGRCSTRPPTPRRRSSRGTTQRSFTLTAATGRVGRDGQRLRATSGSATTAAAGRRSAARPPSTYKLAKEDEGARVRVLVTASNVGRHRRAAPSAASAAPVSPFPPANTVAPVITGTPQRSRTLTATRGTWTGPDNLYAYQWQRDFGEGYVDIAGATGSAYTLTVADVDATVRVLVTATNPDATIVETSEPTAPVLAAGPLNQAPPTVSGTAQRGLTLTGTAGSWSGIGNAIGYQWQSSPDGTHLDARSPARRAPTYALAVGDVGRYLRLLVTVTNPDGTATAASARDRQGHQRPAGEHGQAGAHRHRPARLDAHRRRIGTWSGNGNGYTLPVAARRRSDIAGATNPIYTLAADDVNATVRVRRHRHQPRRDRHRRQPRDRHGPQRRAGRTPSRPTVSGTAQRGQTLTGTTGTWSGIGNSTSYQWQSSPDGSDLDRDRRRDRHHATRSPPATSAATCACS